MPHRSLLKFYRTCFSIVRILAFFTNWNRFSLSLFPLKRWRGPGGNLDVSNTVPVPKDAVVVTTRLSSEQALAGVWEASALGTTMQFGVLSKHPVCDFATRLSLSLSLSLFFFFSFSLNSRIYIYMYIYMHISCRLTEVTYFFPCQSMDANDDVDVLVAQFWKVSDVCVVARSPCLPLPLCEDEEWSSLRRGGQVDAWLEK